MRFLPQFGKKKFILPLLATLVLAILFAPQQAHAFAFLLPLVGVAVGAAIGSYFFGDEVVSKAAQPFLEALEWFFTKIFGFIAGILMDLYMVLAGAMMDVITYFMEVPTDPSSIAFVEQAWNFTRGLANGFFLLILAFIGLATILRLQSYQLQRTLPLLIIVALLVNFSGVLVSFVVDIGNLITNFFLQASLDAPFQQNPWGSDRPGTDAASISQNIARIVYFLFGTILFFIIFLIFGVRIIALWTIVILAPIAFAAAILPITRRWWQRWLGALTDWAFIGVPIAFFIYLAANVLFAPLPPDPTLGVALIGAFAPIAALVLLFLGIIFSFGLAATLGGKVRRGIERTPGRVWRTRAVEKWKGKTAGAISRTIGTAPRGLEAAATRLRQKGQQTSGLRGWGLRRAAQAVGVTGRGTRVTTGVAQRRLMEYEQSRRQMRLPQDFNKWDPQRQAEWISSLTDHADRIQAAKVLADAGNLRFAPEEFQQLVRKDRNRARESGDAFFQEELNAIDRAYPEELSEELDLRRRLFRRKIPKRQVDKIVAAYMAGEDLTEERLEELGVKQDRSGVARTIREAKEKYQEARDQIEQALQREGDVDAQVGIDIEYGIKENIISREDADADRNAAVDKVRTRMREVAQRRGAATEDEINNQVAQARERFLRDTAVTTVYVRDQRSQYVRNIADIDGGDLGIRTGLASSAPQHLREVQQNFGREAVRDIFEGPGGINDQVRNNPDQYALRNPSLWNFLQNNPLGREYPFEGRNYMKDVYGDPTDQLNAHRRRLRILQLAQEDRGPNEDQGVAEVYYKTLQQRRKLAQSLERARAEGVPAAEIEEAENTFREAEQEIQAVEDYYKTGVDLDRDLMRKHGIKVMPDAQQEQRRERLREIQRLWNAPTTSPEENEDEDEGEDGEGTGRRRRGGGPRGGEGRGGRGGGRGGGGDNRPPAPRANAQLRRRLENMSDDQLYERYRNLMNAAAQGAGREAMSDREARELDMLNQMVRNRLANITMSDEELNQLDSLVNTQEPLEEAQGRALEGLQERATNTLNAILSKPLEERNEREQALARRLQETIARRAQQIHVPLSQAELNQLDSLVNSDQPLDEAQQAALERLRERLRNTE